MISCLRLHDQFCSYPPVVQFWLRELAKDPEFLPCPRIHHDRRDGKTHAFFKQVYVSVCEECTHSYWK